LDGLVGIAVPFLDANINTRRGRLENYSQAGFWWLT